MPTGYTSAIGKGATFEEFVWACARGFGAFVTMRDDPIDTPIPDEFKPSSYYGDEVAECLRDLHELDRLDKVGLTERMLAKRSAVMERNHKWKREVVDLHDKYEAMLRRVQSWNPPSEDHAALKAFMLNQIQESIRFDCGDPYEEPLPPDNYLLWRDKRKEELERRLKRARQGHAEEVERVRKRNKWIQQLRESVPVPVKPQEKGQTA